LQQCPPPPPSSSLSNCYKSSRVQRLSIAYVLDIQGNDTSHLRSSTASISKEEKKVVSDNNNLVLDSSLRCNLSLPTSDTLAELLPQLKPPLLVVLIPTMPTTPVVPLSVEQQAAILVAVHQNDNRHVKSPGTWKVQSLMEGKASDVILRSRRYRCRQRHYRYRYYRLHHCKGAPHLGNTSSWRNASQSIIEAETPALVVIPS
jgi:hypothetical protein